MLTDYTVAMVTYENFSVVFTNGCVLIDIIIMAWILVAMLLVFIYSV